MGKVSIVSLGCPKNLVDSDTLLENLKNEGFVFTAEPDNADLIFVNTCGFIEDAKRESIEEILKLKDMKNRGKRLVVFGCLAERYRDELIKEIPEIDGIWGVGEEERIVEYCRQIKFGVRSSEFGDKTSSEFVTLNSELNIPNSSSYAYLKIAEGCNRGCAFCVIPSIRGAYRSIEPDRVLKKAEEHINAGAKEIILVAQDIGSYGREMKDYELPSLVRDISSISGEFWIRLLYLYPAAVNDELLSIISSEDKVCKYLDIPLQHSEDKILKAMGRGGTRDSYIKMIRHAREAVPDITLRTAFIAGFPGETDSDFDGLKDFVESMRFDRLGVFTYSKEEGTPAAMMKGNVPQRTKERRRDEIMKIQSYISLEKNRSLIGKRFRALVDEIDGDVAIARLYSQAPEIDGVVIIDMGQGSRGRGQVKIGDFVEVEIIDAYDYDLKGRLIS